MATLNGVDLFHQCAVQTVPNPVAVQTTAYPGINGLEQLRLGTRGYTTMIRGYLLAADIPSLNAAESALRSYQNDAGTYDFVDNFGTTWTNVRLASVQFEGQIRQGISAAFSAMGYCREYTATLEHLN